MKEYQPIGIANPYFSGVAAASSSVHGLPTDVLGILQASKKLTIRQHVKILPKSCCSCPPCSPQENTYSVFAGLTMDSEAEFLRIDEVSDDWSRCCCKPYHSVKLEVRAVIPVPGSGQHSDYQHFSNDTANSWGSLTKNDRVKAITDAYKKSPVLFTFVRDFGQSCCWAPSCCKKCLSTFVCMEWCQDRMMVFAGPLEDDPKELGTPFYLPMDRVLGNIEQPSNMCGYCHPYLDLKDRKDGTNFAKMDGPCIFGGWSECCCDFRFAVSQPSSDKGAGDIAVITKKKPQSLTGAFAELVTNADNYVISFNSDTMTASQKVTILAAQVFTDYMIFDGNTEKCESKEEGIYCYFWYCMLAGALCPCYILIPKQ